jgi:hypothetical protein
LKAGNSNVERLPREAFRSLLQLNGGLLADPSSLP